MMLSGYSEKFRLEIIQSAIRGYEKQCEAADRGIRPLHRNRGFQKEERWKKKALSKTIWFCQNNSVGFVKITQLVLFLLPLMESWQGPSKLLSVRRQPELALQ